MNYFIHQCNILKFECYRASKSLPTNNLLMVAINKRLSLENMIGASLDILDEDSVIAENEDLDELR